MTHKLIAGEDDEKIELLQRVGNVFRDFRVAAGLTQKQAARDAGTAQARVSYLENGGTDIMLTTIQRWANFYGYELRLTFVPIEDEGTKEFNDALAQALAEIEEENRG